MDIILAIIKFILGFFKPVEGKKAANVKYTEKPEPVVVKKPVSTDGKMHMSSAGKMFLTGLEGICLTKYYDSVGVPTIGVGATISEIPDLPKWPRDKALTVEECLGLLEVSLTKYEKAINKVLKVPLTQEKYDAIVSICYNIGTAGMARSTFMRLINEQASDKAVANAILMWDKPKEIEGRRRKEALLYTTGYYSGDEKALLFPVSPKGIPLYAKGRTISLKDQL